MFRIVKVILMYLCHKPIDYIVWSWVLVTRNLILNYEKKYSPELQINNLQYNLISSFIQPLHRRGSLLSFMQRLLLVSSKFYITARA
jgi:hypothetical protein